MKKKVLIAIPCANYCENETFCGVFALKRPENTELSFSIVRGFGVAEVRNQMVEGSLQGGFDYTLFIDSDIIVPRSLLERLLLLDADIAAGWYVKKIPELRDKPTTLFIAKNESWHNVPESEIPKDRVMPVVGCGMGCTLIKNELFPKVYDGTYFSFIHQKDCEVGEDLVFCTKAIQAANAKILIDTSLRCGHIGKIIL